MYAPIVQSSFLLKCSHPPTSRLALRLPFVIDDEGEISSDAGGGSGQTNSNTGGEGGGENNGGGTNPSDGSME